MFGRQSLREFMQEERERANEFTRAQQQRYEDFSREQSEINRNFIRRQAAFMRRLENDMHESFELFRDSIGAAMDRHGAAIDRVVVELVDQRDERRALIDAVMKLIDRIDRWDPGSTAA